MCGRFSLTADDLGAVARDLRAELDPDLARRWRPRFNVAPGAHHVIVRGEGGARRVVEARFGFATRPGELLVNARAETAAIRPTFREAWRARRCVVPADGFYEWTGPRDRRRPHWLHRPDGRPLHLAALWRTAHEGTPEFTILTVAANADVAALHDRMPAILADGGVDGWLEGGDALALEPRGLLEARPVSSRVNSPRNDDPACLEPAPAGEEAGQLPLL